MSDFGFISDKLEIKFLILYIASRAVGPVPFEVLQDLSMCDDGVDYFGFSECLADLVKTDHLKLEEGLYSITDKGRRNSAICETSLPYSVRMQVEQNLVSYNEQLKRHALVGAQVDTRPQGGYTVTLTLSDELDSLMKLELLVTREDMAKDLQRRFKANAEILYSKILADLYGDEPEEKAKVESEL